MVALQGKKKKSLGWTLGLLPETLSIIIVFQKFFYKYAPPCHYSWFWRDRRASEKAIHFQLKIRWISEPKDKMTFLS